MLHTNIKKVFLMGSLILLQNNFCSDLNQSKAVKRKADEAGSNQNNYRNQVYDEIVQARQFPNEIAGLITDYADYPNEIFVNVDIAAKKTKQHFWVDTEYSKRKCKLNSSSTVKDLKELTGIISGKVNFCNKEGDQVFINISDDTLILSLGDNILSQAHDDWNFEYYCGNCLQLEYYWESDERMTDKEEDAHLRALAGW